MQKQRMRLRLFLYLLILWLSQILVLGCRENKVVAKIGDQVITQKELEAALKDLPEPKREILRDKVLENLMEIKIFSLEARKAGLEKEPKIQTKLERMKNEVLAQSFIKRYLDKEAEPSEKELRSYYLEHQEDFLIPASVLIQHIVVKDRKKAEKLGKSLAKGVSFEEMATHDSICRCWKKGGHHEWMPINKMDRELSGAITTLKIGQLSNLIETPKGYQIIKVLERKNEGKIPFKQARKALHDRFFRHKRHQLIQTYYEQAKVNTRSAEEGVLAKIGDEVITEEALALILDRVSEKENEKERVKKRWVSYFIETKVFSKEAKKVKLEDDPQVIAELLKRSEKILAAAFYKDFIKNQITINDQEIESYYQSHPEIFKVPVKIRVKSILVNTKREAEDVLKELKGGAPFGELAMKKSIHPSSSKAGEIGWFVEGKKEPAFEKIALALQKEEISGLIETKGGYEIIKLMDRKGGQTKSFDEVKQSIKMKLMAQKVEEKKQYYYQMASQAGK